MVNQMDVEDEGANVAKSPIKTVSEELMTKTVILITKGIEMSQPRLIQRAVRQSVAMRKYITSSQVSRHHLTHTTTYLSGSGCNRCRILTFATGCLTYFSFSPFRSLISITTSFLYFTL